jgi:hypothetical protein
MFTPEGLVVASELQPLLKELAALMGTVQEVTLLDRPNAPSNYLVYLYDIKLENYDVQLELVLTPEQKIASMRFK